MKTWTRTPLIPIKNGISVEPLFACLCHVPQNDLPLFSIVIEICVASIAIDSSICAPLFGRSACFGTFNSEKLWNDKKAMNRAGVMPFICTKCHATADSWRTPLKRWHWDFPRTHTKRNCLLQSHGKAIGPDKDGDDKPKWLCTLQKIVRLTNNYHYNAEHNDYQEESFWKNKRNFGIYVN